MKKDLYSRVEEIIENQIRPSLKEHGGDIKIKSLEDGVLRVIFLGSCRGCPSAQSTMEHVIEAKIKVALGNEIERVVLVNDISEDMISFAKSILGKSKE